MPVPKVLSTGIRWQISESGMKNKHTCVRVSCCNTNLSMCLHDFKNKNNENIRLVPYLPCIPIFAKLKPGYSICFTESISKK